MTADKWPSWLCHGGSKAGCKPTNLQVGRVSDDSLKQNTVKGPLRARETTNPPFQPSSASTDVNTHQNIHV